ncbi:MAG: antitoxin family protein [Methanophagales archaeon]|nr:antitoxin family protein [Methanophagales archaeon]
MQKTIEVVYEKGVFKPLEKVEIPEGTKMPITLTRSDALKRYRGILGKVDEKLLKEFELEANDIY